MKKSLLICLLAVVLCVSMLFAACAPSLEAETLEAMKNMLYQMYRNGNPTSNYEVVGVVAAQGKTANIQWSVKVTSGDQNAVKVGSYDEESKKVTIEVDPEPKADVAYTLTATLTDEKGKAYEIDGQPASISFERSLKEFKVNTYAEYLAACQANSGAGSDEQIRIKGYVIGVVCMSSSSKGSLYIQDADGHGYYAYNPVDATKDCETDAQLRAKWPIGTEVYVTGTVTTYNGQYEFNKGCEVRKTGNTVTDAELPYVDATSAFAAATSNEDTALAEYQNRRVTLKDAIVTKIDVTGTKGTSDYKAYYYFTLPGSDVEFNVYYTIYFIDDATASAVCDKLVVGKKVDLSGIISVYSKDFQVYPDSANSVSNVRDVEYTDAEKVAIAKQNLALDSAITEPKSIDLPATGDLGTTITWAFAEGTTADFIAIADGKLTVSALPDSTTEVTVIATITSGSVSETKEFKVSVAASLVMSETRAYAGYVNQVKASKELYLDGGVSGRYLTTTTNASKAVAVYAEKATGGYKFYILDGETKKYITIYSNSDNKTSVNYDAAGETVYTYNPIVNAFTTTFNGSEVYLGTYNDFETISVSNLSYITAENTGVEQFPLELLAAVDGASYTASLKQVKLEGKTLYLDGGVSGRYLTTTEDATAAATVYAEKVAGGFKFYILDGETKKYINLYNNTDNKLSVNYDENGTSVFAYNATVNAWVTIFSETEYYLGTYNDFNTVSASKLSFITAENTGVEQFPLEYNPVVSSHECANVCDKCGKCTNADCKEAVCSEKCPGHQHFTTIEGALTGKKLDTATFTGTVSEIYAEWDEGYGNMSFYVSDGTNQILVFRTTTKANIGDTVTVSGTIDVYNDVPQIAKGSTVTIASQGGGDTPAECTNLCETCGKCLDTDCTQHAEKCEGHDAPEAITTIAGALAAATGAEVELTGTVTAHYNGYKDNFYITDGTDSILVYRANSQVGIGDEVKVVGVIGVFSNKNQVAQGATVTIITVHVCSEWNAATCTDAELCKVCGLAKEGSEALGHTEPNAEGKCDTCGADLDTSSGWVLVTDASTLAAGDKIVIVSNTANYALGTNQKSSNRGTGAVTKDGSKVTFGDDVQVITLEAGASAGTFAFNVGNGYLYAASTSSNHLKTTTSISTGASWTITIASEGVATIKADQTNKNWLRYNPNNGTPLFSCYGSGQEDVCIYKLVGSAE